MSKNNFYCERAWIKKKYSQGVSKNVLLNCVGAFSNKKRSRVMREKGLTEKEYKCRYDFLSRVYYVLNNE